MKRDLSFELAQRLAEQVKDYLHTHSTDPWLAQMHKLPQIGA